MGWQALDLCHQAAKQQIERSAVRALLALAAPEWGEVVLGTAAALAAETAITACAGSLIARARACCCLCRGDAALNM